MAHFKFRGGIIAKETDDGTLLIALAEQEMFDRRENAPHTCLNWAKFAPNFNGAMDAVELADWLMNWANRTKLENVELN